MQVFSTFEHSSFIEMAISTLEKKGIKKESIFVLPLDNQTGERKLFDNIHLSDGTSFIDIGAALATAFSVIGASIGFKLRLGPIYWGLIGAAVGFLIGVGIRFFTEIVIKKRKRLLKGNYSEVIVIVDCEESQGEMVENIFFDYYALGVAKVKSRAPSS
ncbi:hypothetical protein [Bacillus sp. 522_BSPC]|uniref:hypothetical protein n=1 Tax=Bacillus sp. 522_BSPC TaxID=1579338 RepID=UPI000660F9CF|nr:hypothetical protein [Bacillus sp. 522_BSPC]REB75793.1 hypothetical protein CP883_08610 [Cutibacterium acnes]